MRACRLASLVLVLLVAAACAARKTVTTTTLPQRDAELTTWKGRTLADVVAVWGEPAERTSDGEGGTELVYRKLTWVSVSVSGDGSRPPTSEPAPPPGPPSSERVTKVTARFWIDPGGTVYRYWFAPEVYEKGGDTPPAR
jgi:hypothetical protein